KNQLAQIHGFNAEEFSLDCEGITLANETPVTALSSFELDLNIPMLGGKVHGSLARAGKVKRRSFLRTRGVPSALVR
ncbi:hypothetical protein, partial [Lysinibacillus agricola]|uniref:hypothetical protein n=1 Tax=Lysinibacillus agricola TaxID=2590012 RepID=UPI003C1337E6